ncbi:GNAT family N-acetyltransferase [Paenibacillus anaericanus]|uniref:GNAT family N-acetyltransferase n=1 Tax=Paenibacillus anaericanus TaxID=170367 RepID=A0A433YDY8_9BACL|nr:GNAT family N-acetyltransferase [Paenibacillus anaericanus]RUT48088.1 GNAT family N-acetyltransferase [Paenibacillus anaericanus]
MNNPIQIYQATIADLEILVPIFDQYRVFYHQVSDLEGARKFLFSHFEHQESVVFIAKDNVSGQCTGFAQLYPVFSSISMKKAWILNDLFVSEGYRKQGIAKMLLTGVSDFARLTKAKGIELSTALDNKGVQRLYEQFGFTRDEEFYHYYLSL